MYKILRITFCILSVMGAAAVIFVFALVGWLWGLIVLLITAVFGALMVTFKSLQEREERKNSPPAMQGDFITGKVDDEKKD